jgi:protein TonB
VIVASRTAPAADGNGVRRSVPVFSVGASMLFHAGIIAAVIHGSFGSIASPLNPIVVELIPEVGSGPAGGTTSGGEDATGAASPGEPPHDATESPSVEGRVTDKRSPLISAGELRPPMPRPKAKAKTSRSHGKEPPREPQQPALTTSPTSASLAAVIEFAMPTEGAHFSSDHSLQQGDPLVASLGAGGATRASGGAGARPDPGIGDHRSTHGPGFSPGSGANPMPSYPALARRRGIEGKVVLDVLVSADGHALTVDIARSSGSSLLDEAARETIRRWRFRPAMRGGEAIEARATVPVQFSLVDR